MGNKKPLWEKVRNAEQICGTHMALNCPQTTEILGQVGFDFIWVDTEHTAAGFPVQRARPKAKKPALRSSVTAWQEKNG